MEDITQALWGGKVIEMLNREIRCRTHVVGTRWCNKKYMNMKHLEAAAEEASIAGWIYSYQSGKPKCKKLLTLPDKIYGGRTLVIPGA